MKTFKIIDNDGLGTLSWTEKYPTTLDDIAHAMHIHHQVFKNSISISRVGFLPTYGTPKLSHLLNAYNLTLKEV